MATAHTIDLDRSTAWYLCGVLIFLFTARVAVLADPAPPLPAGEDSRIPLSQRVFDMKKKWRESEKPEHKWRDSENKSMTLENKSMTLEKERFQSPPPPLYDPREHPDPWDPFSSIPEDGVHTTPPTLFKFRF